MIAPTYRAAYFAILGALFSASPGFGDDAPLDSAMYRSPELRTPKIESVFSAGLMELWLGEFDGTNVESKCTAAQSIAQAHKWGMKGLEATIPKLLEELNRQDAHSTTRLAVAHALIALDARRSADSLFRQLASDSSELRELIEPALAKWDYQPIRAVWLERLKSGPPYRRQHILAIRGLALAREENAAATLRDLTLSRNVPVQVRLEAAQALGMIKTSGLEKDATLLVQDSSPQGTSGRLMAAMLLRQHKGDDAEKLLQTLSTDPDPVAAAAALARLVEIDCRLVVPMLEQVLTSPDPTVRSFGVTVLFRQASDSHIKLLGVRLSDPHPEVRIQARRALLDLAARQEFRTAVIGEGMRVLAGSDWRGQEQAAILLAQLDHKPAARRLVELLAAQRAETFVAAAWGLRQLAVADTLPEVVEFIRTQNQKLLASGPVVGNRDREDAIDRQLTQLVQFLGQARYQPSDPLLRAILPRFVPQRNPIGVEPRAAAAWALGLIHEGQPNSEVVSLCEARLTDTPPGPPGPEHDLVRQMAAITLGRMRAKNSLQTLQRFYEGKPTLDRVNNACGWAIEQLTGVVVPPPGTIYRPVAGWFLNRIE